jgi:hypothetical protein
MFEHRVNMANPSELISILKELDDETAKHPDEFWDRLTPSGRAEQVRKLLVQLDPAMLKAYDAQRRVAVAMATARAPAVAVASDKKQAPQQHPQSGGPSDTAPRTSNRRRSTKQSTAEETTGSRASGRGGRGKARRRGGGSSTSDE